MIHRDQKPVQHIVAGRRVRDGKDQKRLIDIGHVGPHKFVPTGQELYHIALHGHTDRVCDVDFHVVADQRLYAERAENASRPAPVDLVSGMDLIESRYALDDLAFCTQMLCIVPLLSSQA